MLGSAPHGVTLSPHAPPYPRTPRDPPSSQPKPWTLAALGAAAAWRDARRSACSSRLSARRSPRASCRRSELDSRCARSLCEQSASASALLIDR